MPSHLSTPSMVSLAYPSNNHSSAISAKKVEALLKNVLEQLTQLEENSLTTTVQDTLERWKYLAPNAPLPALDFTHAIQLFLDKHSEPRAHSIVYLLHQAEMIANSHPATKISPAEAAKSLHDSNLTWQEQLQRAYYAQSHEVPLEKNIELHPNREVSQEKPCILYCNFEESLDAESQFSVNRLPFYSEMIWYGVTQANLLLLENFLELNKDIDAWLLKLSEYSIFSKGEAYSQDKIKQAELREKCATLLSAIQSNAISQKIAGANVFTTKVVESALSRVARYRTPSHDTAEDFIDRLSDSVSSLIRAKGKPRTGTKFDAIIQQIETPPESISSSSEFDEEYNDLNTLDGFQEFLVAIGDTDCKFYQWLQGLEHYNQVIQAFKEERGLLDTLTHHQPFLAWKPVLASSQNLDSFISSVRKVRHQSLYQPTPKSLKELIEEANKESNQPVIKLGKRGQRILDELSLRKEGSFSLIEKFDQQLASNPNLCKLIRCESLIDALDIHGDVIKKLRANEFKEIVANAHRLVRNISEPKIWDLVEKSDLHPSTALMLNDNAHNDLIHNFDTLVATIISKFSIDDNNKKSAKEIAYLSLRKSFSNATNEGAIVTNTKNEIDQCTQRIFWQLIQAGVLTSDELLLQMDKPLLARLAAANSLEAETQDWNLLGSQHGYKSLAELVANTLLVRQQREALSQSEQEGVSKEILQQKRQAFFETVVTTIERINKNWIGKASHSLRKLCELPGISFIDVAVVSEEIRDKIQHNYDEALAELEQIKNAFHHPFFKDLEKPEQLFQRVAETIQGVTAETLYPYVRQLIRHAKSDLLTSCYTEEALTLGEIIKISDEAALSFSRRYSNLSTKDKENIAYLRLILQKKSKQTSSLNEKHIDSIFYSFQNIQADITQPFLEQVIRHYNLSNSAVVDCYARFKFQKTYYIEKELKEDYEAIHAELAEPSRSYDAFFLKCFIAQHGENFQLPLLGTTKEFKDYFEEPCMRYLDRLEDKMYPILKEVNIPDEQICTAKTEEFQQCSELINDLKDWLTYIREEIFKYEVEEDSEEAIQNISTLLSTFKISSIAQSNTKLKQSIQTLQAESVQKCIHKGMPLELVMLLSEEHVILLDRASTYVRSYGISARKVLICPLNEWIKDTSQRSDSNFDEVLNLLLENIDTKFFQESLLYQDSLSDEVSSPYSFASLARAIVEDSVSFKVLSEHSTALKNIPMWSKYLERYYKSPFSFFNSCIYSMRGTRPNTIKDFDVNELSTIVKQAKKHDEDRKFKSLLKEQLVYHQMLKLTTDNIRKLYRAKRHYQERWERDPVQVQKVQNALKLDLENILASAHSAPHDTANHSVEREKNNTPRGHNRRPRKHHADRHHAPEDDTPEVKATSKTSKLSRFFRR